MSPAARFLFTHRVRTVFFGALLAAGPWGELAGQPAAPAADDVVTLPPLMVEEKGVALPWRYLELPGCELLSVCDDATSAEFARRRHRLEELLHVLVPEKFCSRSSVPEAHILFNEETGRARSKEIIAEMVKKEGAFVAPDGTVTPLRRDDAPVLSDARGWPRPPAPPRIRFLPNMRLWDQDATAVFAILQDTTRGQFTFSPDRVAFLLQQRTPALPEWFIEGTLGLYGRSELRENEIAIEPAIWLSAEESAALGRDPERPRTLLPMEELFSRRRPRDAAEARELDRVWQAQCTLFVRWAVAEKNGARKAALWNFVERLETEPVSEALFREQFGLGFADARDRLSDYLPAAVSRSVTLAAPKSSPLPRLKFRAATDLEVARIRGDWERMEINYVRKRYPAMTEKYVEQARHTLRRAYDRGERDPRLLAILGLTEVDAGNPDGAREFLEAAVRGKVVRPRAYFELAFLRYKALLPDGADDDAKLTDDQARDVLGPLLVARLDHPPLPESYTLMVDVWIRSAAPLTRENLAILNEGVRLFPHVSALVMRAIYLNVTAGQVAPALALAETGLRHARDPAMRERFERVRAELSAAKN
jgi:hypothetical protein